MLLSTVCSLDCGYDSIERMFLADALETAHMVDEQWLTYIIRVASFI
jgi:hypothetical protein